MFTNLNCFNFEFLSNKMSTDLPISATATVSKDVRTKNEAYIAAMKKASGAKKQTVLPSATTANNEWAVRQGWSMHDAAVWRNLCEKAKYAQDDVEGDGIMALLFETISMAGHCDTHVIGLLHFARTTYDRGTWDIDTIDYLSKNLLAEPSKTVDNLDLAIPGSPPRRAVESKTAAPAQPRAKRRLEYEDQATQPYTPPSDVDEDVDDKLRD